MVNVGKNTPYIERFGIDSSKDPLNFLFFPSQVIQWPWPDLIPKRWVGHFSIFSTPKRGHQQNSYAAIYTVDGSEIPARKPPFRCIKPMKIRGIFTISTGDRRMSEPSTVSPYLKIPVSHCPDLSWRWFDPCHTDNNCESHEWGTSALKWFDPKKITAPKWHVDIYFSESF